MQSLKIHLSNNSAIFFQISPEWHLCDPVSNQKDVQLYWTDKYRQFILYVYWEDTVFLKSKIHTECWDLTEKLVALFTPLRQKNTDSTGSTSQKRYLF